MRARIRRSSFCIFFLCWVVTFSSVSAREVPASLIKLPEGDTSAILVAKKSQRLKVYRKSADSNLFVTVFETDCSTGEVYGRKGVEGDKKTPEGVYFIKKIFEDRYLTPIYGKRAFTTDYPNIMDTKLGRTGSAIWIHGTNRPLKPMDSNGCVAMRNKDVVKLDAHIRPDLTPIIFAEEIECRSMTEIETERAMLLDFLSRWCQTINTGRFDELLQFYQDADPPDADGWVAWESTRASSGVIVDTDRVGIYRQGEQLVMLFDLLVMGADVEDVQNEQEGQNSISIGRRKWFLAPTPISETEDALETVNVGFVGLTPVNKNTRPTNPISEDRLLNDPTEYCPGDPNWKTVLINEENEVNDEAGSPNIKNASIGVDVPFFHIVADHYQVLSLPVKPGETPLISGADKLRREMLAAAEGKK